MLKYEKQKFRGRAVCPQPAECARQTLSRLAGTGAPYRTHQKVGRFVLNPPPSATTRAKLSCNNARQTSSRLAGTDAPYRAPQKVGRFVLNPPPNATTRAKLSCNNG